jgi:arylsulfatase A-like enzyme
MNRPNILYIHSHDTGRYVQPYGHAIPTPNLQRLAEQGVMFRRAFCASPSCSASRSALLTGQCSHSSGMLGLAHRGFSLNDPKQHLASFLAGEGYQTILCGLQHEAKDASTLGYSRIVPMQHPTAATVAPAAEELLAERMAGPFFLAVGFFETHRYGPKQAGAFMHGGAAADGKYILPPAPLPDTPAIRGDMADFKQSAGELDGAIGRVLAALDRSGKADNTFVICTTDHGLPFPDMKAHLTDHGTGVMLFLRHPKHFTGGQVCDQMVSHVDLFPTICELANIAPPPWLQGKSIVPLGRDPSSPVHEAVFSEINFHAAYEPQRAVRTERWKYIRRFERLDRRVLPNTDDSPSKSALLAYDWAHHAPAEEQVYDLMLDPNEACNLAADPAAAEVLPALRERLAKWMHETNDPLLAGPLQMPEGAVVNRVTDASSNVAPVGRGKS